MSIPTSQNHAETQAHPNTGLLRTRQNRHWRRGIFLGILVTGLLFNFFGNVPSADKSPAENVIPVYATVQLIREPSPFLFEPPARKSAEEWESYQQRQAQLVILPSVLDGALRELSECELIKKQQKPRAWLESTIEVSFTTKELLRIGLRNPSIPDAVDIVNAVVNSYVNEVISRRNVEMVTETERLGGNIRELEDQVRRKRGELASLRDSLEMKPKDGLARWQELLQSELTQVRLKAATLQAKLIIANTRLEGINGADASDAEFEEEQQKDVDQFNRFCQQHLAEKLIADITTSNQVGNDILTNHQNRLAALGKALEIHRLAIRQGVEGLHKQKKVSIRQNIAQIEQDLAVTRSLEERLREDHKEISKQLEGQNRSSIDVEMLLQEVRRSEEILSQVVRKRVCLRFDLERSPDVLVLHLAGN